MTKYAIKNQSDGTSVASKIKAERKELRIKLDLF